jgi:hypothetical protein
MDHETLELVRQLCTRAGATMEDASVVALVWNDEIGPADRLDQLEIAIGRLSALVAAAKTLLADVH